MSILNQGRALEGLQQWEEARAAYEQAIELNTDQAEVWSREYALACRNCTHVLLCLQQYEDAVSACERAPRVHPPDASLQVELGTALLQLHRPVAALTAFEQALRLDKHLGVALLGRGHALQALGRLEEAKAAYKQACRSEAWEAGQQ